MSHLIVEVDQVRACGLQPRPLANQAGRQPVFLSIQIKNEAVTPAGQISEIVGDVDDPEHRTLGREAAKNRQAALQRLRAARLAEVGVGPSGVLR